MRDGMDEYTLLCEGCGYVLEGLEDEAERCPECGRPIGESRPERRTRSPGLLMVIRSPGRALRGLRIDESRVSTLRMVRRSVIAGAAAATALVLVLMHSRDAQFALNLPVPVPMGVAVCWWVAGAIVTTLAFYLLTELEGLGLRVLGRRRGFRVTADISRTVVSHGTAGWVLASVGLLVGSVVWLLGQNVAVSRGGPGFGHPGGMRLPLPGSIKEWLGWTGVGLGVGVALAGFLIFEFFAYLGLRRCRFANRGR